MKNLISKIAVMLVFTVMFTISCKKEKNSPDDYKIQMLPFPSITTLQISGFSFDNSSNNLSVALYVGKNYLTNGKVKKLTINKVDANNVTTNILIQNDVEVSSITNEANIFSFKTILNKSLFGLSQTVPSTKIVLVVEDANGVTSSNQFDTLKDAKVSF